MSSQEFREEEESSPPEEEWFQRYGRALPAP